MEHTHEVVDIKRIVCQPIFFERNRVYRIYKGGKPYKEIFKDGYDDGTDNMFPEEWVASKVKSITEVFGGNIKKTNQIKLL